MVNNIIPVQYVLVLQEDLLQYNCQGALNNLAHKLQIKKILKRKQKIQINLLHKNMGKMECGQLQMKFLMDYLNHVGVIILNVIKPLLR
jgi:hypothetical protein